MFLSTETLRRIHYAIMAVRFSWLHQQALCRDLVEARAPMAEPFAEKKLLGALVGQTITTNAASKQFLMSKAADCGIPILILDSCILPPVSYSIPVISLNGHSYSADDSCIR